MTIRSPGPTTTLLGLLWLLLLLIAALTHIDTQGPRWTDLDTPTRGTP